MLRYVLKRLLIAVPTLLIIITLAFFLIRIAPGGPFDQERTLPAEIQANLNVIYHLDEPLPKQYVRYLGNIIQGDFGPSFQYKDRTVTELIGYGLPVSLKLGGMAMLIAVLVGCVLGSIAAIRQNSATDYSVMSSAMIGIVIPNFVMAPILTLLLAIYAKWLPVGGWGQSWQQMVLPVITLALPQIAYISRLMRGSMIEVLHANHVRTARAKGLSEINVVLRHCLKPALMPVVSYLGPACATILTGSVVIEQIFGIPGIGRYFVQGALNRDYTLVMGVVVFYGSLIVLFNLLVDLAYAFLDPKVRLTA
ncbi:oligopeptide ABC transporter permease OppB [Suttonella sp. R2A3]|uniref:oligopeptide ABC transporter permease OppB n=1 Tax=Suttonella sp. R2A3 TaxID=2908648 RepID=UPI001F1B37F3|nr:oligopeptide ABC transporter permease OppB [Suttonella sp. R2A3]UJF25166.1 oligopeptide ABC transporter permease OppB [Suttonella sp. R2A3]